MEAIQIEHKYTFLPAGPSFRDYCDTFGVGKTIVERSASQEPGSESLARSFV
jgi:hypothetical protein